MYISEYKANANPNCAPRPWSSKGIRFERVHDFAESTASLGIRTTVKLEVNQPRTQKPWQLFYLHVSPKGIETSFATTCTPRSSLWQIQILGSMIIPLFEHQSRKFGMDIWQLRDRQNKSCWSRGNNLQTSRHQNTTLTNSIPSSPIIVEFRNFESLSNPRSQCCL